MLVELKCRAEKGQDWPNGILNQWCWGQAQNIFPKCKWKTKKWKQWHYQYGSFWGRVDDNQNESHNQRHFKKAFLTLKRYEYSDWNSSLCSSQNYKEKSIAR